MILNNRSKLLSSWAILKHSDLCNCKAAGLARFADSAGEETLSPEGPRQLITAAEQAAEFRGHVGSLCSPTLAHGDCGAGSGECRAPDGFVHSEQRRAWEMLISCENCWSPMRIAIKPVPLSFQGEKLALLPWKISRSKGRSVRLQYSRLVALERDFSTASWRDHCP